MNHDLDSSLFQRQVEIPHKGGGGVVRVSWIAIGYDAQLFRMAGHINLSNALNNRHAFRQQHRGRYDNIHIQDYS